MNSKRLSITTIRFGLGLAATLAFTALLSLSGCAGTNETAVKGKHALVCPQCKMVAVAKVDSPYVGGGGRGGYGYGPGYNRTRTVYEDSCPGCRGAITTFFSEGKWKHKCSVCKESPFTCPVFHPIKR